MFELSEGKQCFVFNVALPSLKYYLFLVRRLHVELHLKRKYGLKIARANFPCPQLEQKLEPSTVEPQGNKTLFFFV